MGKFLFLYLDPADKPAPDMSPDEMQAQLQLWWDWLGAGQEAGWVVEMGEALNPGGKIVQSDKSVIDGPHAEAKELIGGFTVVEAESYEAACQHAMGCPIFATGGSVEVREIMDMTPPEPEAS